MRKSGGGVGCYSQIFCTRVWSLWCIPELGTESKSALFHLFYLYFCSFEGPRAISKPEPSLGTHQTPVETLSDTAVHAYYRVPKRTSPELPEQLAVVVSPANLEAVEKSRNEQSAQIEGILVPEIGDRPKKVLSNLQKVLSNPSRRFSRTPKKVLSNPLLGPKKVL